jgi:hypothetical protein
MSAIFPKWTNRLPLMISVGVVLLGGGLVAGAWYYLTPKYSRVGYQPIQPVSFSHATHADQLGIDCRYCHNAVEKSWYSNIPASSTCMNCHNQVLRDDPRFPAGARKRRRASPFPGSKSIGCRFVYFNHSVHVDRGISCVECHGPVNQMDEVYHYQPLSMTFASIVIATRDQASPDGQNHGLNWKPESPEKQREFGTKAMEQWHVESLQNCSACHR